MLSFNMNGSVLQVQYLAVIQRGCDVEACTSVLDIVSSAWCKCAELYAAMVLPY